MLFVRMICWLLVMVGSLLALGGAGGFCSLYMASKEYVHAVGTVQKCQTKKVYRHRKLRYESEMSLIYPTEKYGELSVTEVSHWPFRSKGDKIVVWYHPDRPRDIRLPQCECILWGFLLVIGVVCIYGGIYFWKNRLYHV